MADEIQTTPECPDCDSAGRCTHLCMGETETGVLRALAGAVDDLVSAKMATRNGFISDECDNALAAIRRAMRTAVGSDHA